MASTAEKEKSATKWTVADEATLLQTLRGEKANGSWGDNNPKPSAYTACELALAGSEKVSGGGSKGVSAIKSRWQRVHCSFVNIFSLSDQIDQLKQEFDIVKQLRSLSGFGWDDERKIVTATADVWERYLEVSPSYVSELNVTLFCVQKHPKAKPWRKKSFPLYDEISELIEGTRANGSSTFRPSSHTPASKTLAISDTNIDPILLTLDKSSTPDSDEEKVSLDIYWCHPTEHHLYQEKSYATKPQKRKKSSEVETSSVRIVIISMSSTCTENPIRMRTNPLPHLANAQRAMEKPEMIDAR
jgi:hypothetical protein